MSGEQPVVDGTGRELDRIRLTGIAATGRHGLLPEERRDGQQFLADVVVHLDTRRAAARDDLTHSVDYGRLAQEVHAVLAGEPVDLIETVAERIAATVLAHPGVLAVDVAVHKPQAPIRVPFGDVVVEIHRDRHKLPAAEPYRAAGPAESAEPADEAPDQPVAAEAAAAPADASEPAGAPRTAPAHAHPRTAPLPLAEVPDVIPLPAPSAAVGAATAAAPLEIPTFADSAPGERPMPAPDDLSETTVLPRTPAGPVAGPDVAAAPSGDVLDQRPAVPVDVVVALGSNVGPSQETLREAVAELDQVPGVEVVAVSPLARTAPVGGPDQPDYLDAVVLARTTLAPRELLRALQELEDRHGRVREERWGPRTLDLDMIVYGSVLAVTDDLELPHPRAHERAFVLQPWAQVDPGAVLPGLGGGPVAQLAETAPDRDGVRWMALDWLTAPVQHTGTVEVPPRPAAGPAPVPAPASVPVAVPLAPSAPVPGLEDDQDEAGSGPVWPWGP